MKDKDTAKRAAELMKPIEKQIMMCRSEERRVGKEGRSRWSPDH